MLRSLLRMTPADDPYVLVPGVRGLVVFDGDCGFCRRWVRHMETWFRRHPASVAWQHTDLAALGLTPEGCAHEVKFVAHDMSVSGGSDAVARILIVAGFPFSVAGRVMLLPGARRLSRFAYRWVADNRHRFRGDPVAP